MSGGIGWANILASSSLTLVEAKRELPAKLFNVSSAIEVNGKIGKFILGITAGFMLNIATLFPSSDVSLALDSKKDSLPILLQGQVENMEIQDKDIQEWCLKNNSLKLSEIALHDNKSRGAQAVSAIKFNC